MSATPKTQTITFEGPEGLKTRIVRASRNVGLSVYIVGIVTEYLDRQTPPPPTSTASMTAAELCEIQARLGMTSESLAARCDRVPSTWSGYRNGTKQVPEPIAIKMRKLDALIAKAFDTQPGEHKGLSL